MNFNFDEILSFYRYIPKEHSPTNEHMLIAAVSVSGTLSVFRVKGIGEYIICILNIIFNIMYGLHWTEYNVKL